MEKPGCDNHHPLRTCHADPMLSTSEVFFFLSSHRFYKASPHTLVLHVGKAKSKLAGAERLARLARDLAESPRAATALPLARGGTSSRGPSRVRLPQRTVSHTCVSFRLALEGKNGRFPQPDSCSLDRCATKTLKCVVKDQKTTQARKAVPCPAQATGRAA